MPIEKILPNKRRKPWKDYDIVRLPKGGKRTIHLKSQRSFGERRRINLKVGWKLTGGRTLTGTAEELFIGSIDDRGKSTRPK